MAPPMSMDTVKPQNAAEAISPISLSDSPNSSPKGPNRLALMANVIAVTTKAILAAVNNLDLFSTYVSIPNI